MLRVLVVDDAAFMRQMLGDLLQEAGHIVVGEASNGHEALSLYRTLKPDVVTMDIVMPHMSGIEAVRAILEEDAQAKIIVISAIGQEAMITEALDCGVRDYIVKPFRREDVLAAVARIGADP